MDNQSYTEVNAQTVDQWVAGGWEWGIPISSDTYAKALAGEWDVLLTPIRPVPKEWFPAMKGVRLLGLASGGGQQMPIFAALGAKCTVLDYSDRQLDSERMVAQREGYTISIVKSDMTKRFPFEDASFDVIFHPVSNCYIEDVLHVWRECFRVLRPGGTLLAGMDNGVNFLVDDTQSEPLIITNALPYNPLKDQALYQKAVENGDGVQFSHTMEEQISGQLKAGFHLIDLYEDRDRDCALAKYTPQYIATRAMKPKG